MKKVLLVLALISLAVPVHALQRNVAGQTICSHLYDLTGGNVTTGTTTVYVTIDNGSQAAGSTATHKGNGLWCYAPSKAETNGDHVVYTFVNAGAVTSSRQVYDYLTQDIPESYGSEDAGYYLYNLLQTMLGQISEGVLLAQPTVTGQDLTIFVGDAQPLTFDLGSDWNLTGKTVTFTVKKYRTDTSTTISRAATVTDAANGIATITLTTTETDIDPGQYVYDVTVETTGDSSTHRTAVDGKIVFTQDVR